LRRVLRVLKRPAGSRHQWDEKEIPMKIVLTTVLAMFAGAALAQGPSDPQIAGIVVTANQIDIDAGKLARSKSKNKEVQAFAKQMVTDHGAVNKQAGALAKKLGVKPEDNETSASLKK